MKAVPLFATLVTSLAVIAAPQMQAHATGTDPFYDEAYSSTLVSIPLEIPSADLSASPLEKKCTVSWDIHAEYYKNRGSWDIHESIWGKMTPTNCDEKKLPYNYQRVTIADHGSPGLSSTQETMNAATSSGSRVNYVDTAQWVSMYSFPTDQHIVGSKITFDWVLYLQWGSTGNQVTLCAHAEAIFPGPTEGGFGPCQG